MKKFYVYIHTCPNGKKYVGLTTIDPKKRWRRGNGYKSNKHFYFAIQKYGWDNIEHQVIEIDTMSEMYYLEKYLISYYQTNNPDFGYNNSIGGEKSSYGYRWHHTEETKKKIGTMKKGKHCSEETKRKMSESLKGRIAPNKGIPHSEETKRKMSESLKGKHHSKETKKKISEALKGNQYHKGISISDEVKMKLSNKMKGRKRIYNEDGTYHY